MLATIGLERLESGLDRDTVSATDVAEFLEQAQAADVRTLAHEGLPEALDGMHRRLQARALDPEVAKTYITDDEWSNLPTPLYVDNGPNPGFRPSRQANRV
ncbi:hypothetical protein DVS77_25175 [Mycolicibacterium moriokaense]|nr:hypothetical protein DVS77_25175 [Mycolicibacterium moriokaense]